MLFRAAALALSTAVGAATARVDAVAVPASSTAIRVSAALNEEVWQLATPTDAFRQREPQDGGEPSQRTEFRVAYDAFNLFVKVRAYDKEADKIVTYLTRRSEER